LKNDKSEVKAMIAGALEVVAVNQLDDKLSNNTPVEVICDLVSSVAETAKVVVDIIDDNVTVLEAVDKIGRAGITAVCRSASTSLKMMVGAIHDAAVATWEGIKENIGHKIKALWKGIGLIQ
jgi:hypothetical protein